MSELKELAQETPAADAEVSVPLEYSAIGLVKDPKDNQWKVTLVKYNTSGLTGDFQVLYSTGFRADAIEAFKIQTVKLGLFG